MFIYKITNNINNKVYIGQTIRPVGQRFSRHINDAINNIIDTHFARAIRKYGKENFTISIIDKAKSQEELTQKEQYWIQQYDSINNGYNETIATCKSGGNTYYSKTLEELQIIGNKIKESKLGKNNPHCRAVKCKNINSDEEIHFDTVRECKEYFQESNHQFITRRCNNILRNLYKDEWMFAYEENEYGIYEPVGHIKKPDEKSK